VQTVTLLAEAMRDDAPVERGSPPPDLSSRVAGRRDRSRPDAAVGGAFGEVLVAPRARYRRGDTVRAEFVGAYPNNDLHRGGSYLEVQRELPEGWLRVADDGDWATKFQWRRAGRAGSRIAISWDVPDTAEPGRYRLVYRGDMRTAGGALRTVTGVTTPFEVR
jgi:neutral ceramidase